MRGYVLSDRAQADLEEIWWYAFRFERSDARAGAWVDKVYNALDSLAESPNIGRKRDWLETGQLAFSTGRYLIVYEIGREGIEVARISGADSDRGTL